MHNKILGVFFILILLFSFCGCDGQQSVDGTLHPIRTNPPTTQPTTQPATQAPQPTQPDPCADGHTFQENMDACSFCGVNYFEATLKFAPAGDHYIVSGRGTCTRTEIVIPETFNGKPVTVVDKDCFTDQDDITRVVLPESIVDIRKGAFYSCDSLEAINLPEGLTKIGDSAFRSCGNLKNVVFPSTLLSIGTQAFLACKSLTEAMIPSGVTYIGVGAFAICVDISQVTLPDGIKELPDGLFKQCMALDTIVIPETVTKIGLEFASECSIKTLEIGNQVESIGNRAFAGCSELETVSIGSNVRSIGEEAFAQCGKLTAVILPDTVTSIGEKCFMDCVSLQSVNIPSGVKNIGMDAFTNCSQLEANVYNGMKYLGPKENPYLALIGRVDMNAKDLIIHDATTLILRETFEGEPFENLYIGKSLENVSADFLHGLKRLATINVHPEHTQYHASGDCLIETSTQTLIKGTRNSVIPGDGSVTTIGKMAYAYMEEISLIAIPNTVNRIQANAFAYCSNLEALVIGSGVQVIDHDQLIGCEKFVKVYYCGTEQAWNNIKITGRSSGGGVTIGGNIELLAATVYFYSETQPTEPGNYWRYVDGVPTPWEPEA